MRGIIRRAVLVGVTILGVTAATATAAGVSPAAGETQQILAGQRLVTASSLTLWNAPSGGSAVGTWHAGKCFVWAAIEGSWRFRTFTESGATVWVTADPAYSEPLCN
jgi:hypothetical protein